MPTVQRESGPPERGALWPGSWGGGWAAAPPWEEDGRAGVEVPGCLWAAVTSGALLVWLLRLEFRLEHPSPPPPASAQRRTLPRASPLVGSLAPAHGEGLWAGTPGDPGCPFACDDPTFLHLGNGEIRTALGGSLRVGVGAWAQSLRPSWLPDIFILLPRSQRVSGGRGWTLSIERGPGEATPTSLACSPLSSSPNICPPSTIQGRIGCP